jgi:hypothetical protein
MVGDVAVAKNLTEKQYVKFIDNATEEATKKGMTLEKYLEELANSIKFFKNVPGIKIFSKWFDEIVFEDFMKLWVVKATKERIKRRIRHPGGLHEWLMVSRADVFKKWGVSMNEIKRLRTKVEFVIFKNPPGKHGGFGSTRAHNEILDLIDTSKNFNQFKKKLIIWSENRLEGGSKSLPKGFFD